VPKLATVLRRGYGLADLRADLIAGLTVAVVALPLAMAIAIASGATPDKGLTTAIVAGFLISLLGGSRVQIGGPTAAFIPVVFVAIERFGHGGLLLAMLLAGVMLIIAGLLRVGTWMRYMPKPVITGFTAGIAVSIALSQINDALGLGMATVPADFLARIHAYARGASGVTPAALLLSVATIAMVVAMRRWRTTSPSMLVAILVASSATAFLNLPVETIALRFPQGLPSALPTPALPVLPFDRTLELLPTAFTIAFLAGVESLLSAVVADGMCGGRHRSNAELIAQGVANCASACVGGLPATGALARTATNVRAGARSPVAGMAHAVFLLVIVWLVGPLIGYVPLAALAGVLLLVAWNMAEFESFRHLLRGPIGDRAVLLVTFVLTVTVDLTIAIEVGVVLAALLFMHRMAGVVEIAHGVRLIEPEPDDDAASGRDTRIGLAPGVEVYEVAGPLFFAVANRLDDLLDQYFQPPKVLILRLGQVPLIDASGVTALMQCFDRARRLGIRVVIEGLQPLPRRTLAAMHALEHPALLAETESFAEALDQARVWVERTD
jgi:SulP family sulfate permease